ncbi:murein biosynthesis integral membrane protein MurJ [Turneriella parva]|uniref:Probable lipid II flippase MurJ n=1 Tax=Turneriella parva (strain ATCC BAA-1111 / DSM 21527 / NCTC 11395 / H) TaxID=869212 RepID=I4B7M3_TURPD|nr:murein biosynthesis integral membrane protein MurJ [Turneriella parva]AFM13280.1 integral membrane protein MviN [Turneriella parva DSM 21527]
MSLEQKSHNRETLKNSSIFSLFTSMSRVLGLLRDMLKAYAFGTGPLSVAFDIAFRLNNMLRNLVAEGALSQAFVPLYNRYAAEGENKAREAAGVVIVFVAITMTLVTCVVIFALPYLMPLLLASEHMPADQLQLTINLSQLLFPYLVMMSVASLYMGIQYSHKIFWAASFGPALLNIVILVFFGAYAAWVRLTHGAFDVTSVYVFSIATLAAAVAQVAFQIYTVHRRGLAPRYSFSLKHGALKALGSMMLPAVFAASMQEVGQLIDVYLATSLSDRVPEAISALTYSHRLIQLPIGVFGVAVATASLPQLSKIYQTDATGETFSGSLAYSVRLNFFFLLPAVAGLMVFSEPIVRVIFQRGAFTGRSTEVTALALMCYAPGILAYSLQKLFTISLYARMNTHTPAIITAVALVMNFALSLFLMQSMLHGGLAAGSAIAAWCGVLIYIVVLLRGKVLRSPITLLQDLARIFAVNLVFAGLLVALRQYVFPERALLQLAVAIPVAMAAYVALARVAHIAEAHVLTEFLTRLRRRLPF